MTAQRTILVLLATIWLLVSNGTSSIAAQTRLVQPMTLLPMALAPQVTFTKIAAGGQGHTCALTSGGGVKCWGYNAYGQLGDGTTTNRSMPVNVSGLTSITAIATGAEHTCALTNTNGVKCWGHNHYGQLGNGTTTDSSTPVDVSGLAGIVQIAAGVNHTCALTSSLGVMCWGRNDTGQLGDTTTTQRSLPVNVSTLNSNSVSAIALGQGNQTCARTITNGAKCWGSNVTGQLGNGTTTQSTTPVNVMQVLAPPTALSNVTAIATGVSFTCAWTSLVSPPSTGVKCWGLNTNGQLGDGTTTQRTTPVNVLQSLSPPGGTPLSNVAGIATGANDACALTSSGGVKCWGKNDQGQLGDTTTTQRTLPVNVSGLTSGVAEITMGYDHACARTIAGQIKCWGSNAYGQLGNGTTSSSNIPVDLVLNNANLSNLALSTGTLSPSFASATTAYTANVANSVASITVTPTNADPSASTKVNNTTVTSGSASGVINLNVGSNTITIVVTAQDGTTTKTYTVTVTRAATSTSKLYLPLVLNGYAPPPICTSSPLALGPRGEICPNWLLRLNYLRSLAGLSPVTEHAAWYTGEYNHSRYVVKHNELTHVEVKGDPWYTDEGAEAGLKGNVAGSYDVNATDESFIDVWMRGPFHALGMIDPKLAETELGVFRENNQYPNLAVAATLDTGRGRTATGLVFPVKWPGDGKTSDLLSYNGSETPDPLYTCLGYTAYITKPTGMPIYLQLGAGNVKPDVKTYSLVQGSTKLDVCEFDETNYDYSDKGWKDTAISILNARSAVVLMPKKPLTKGASYTVSITSGSTEYTWTFNVASDAKMPAPMDETQ